MKRFSAFLAIIISLFVLIPLLDDAAFAQSIEFYNDREVCPGASISLDGGLYRRLTETCVVTSVLANGGGSNLAGAKYVTPSATTTYYVTYTDKGITETKQVRVLVITPPTLKISLTTDVSAGICAGKEVKINVTQHSDDVYWSISTQPGSSEVANAQKSYTLTETCRVWAQSYNSCGFTDTALDFVVNQKPVLEKINLELKPELSGDFCMGCGFFPRVGDILTVPSDVTLQNATITWKDNTTDEVAFNSAGVFTKEASIHATVSKTNACGSVQGSVDTTFTLKVNKVVDCTPRMNASVSLKPCEDREVHIENTHQGGCTITPTPSLTATAAGNKLVVQAPSHYQDDGLERYSWRVRWENFSHSDPAQRMHVNANYTVSCPYSSTSSFTGNYQEDIQVLADTSYLSFKYEYCPDGKAELTIEGKKTVVTITKVELASPAGGFDNLFTERVSESEPSKKVFESKSAISVSTLATYTPLRLKVSFGVKEGNCDFTVTREETVQLKQKTNCSMSLEAIPSGMCIGESRRLRLLDVPDEMIIDRIELGEHPEFRFKVTPFASGTKELEFFPYYAGAPAVPTRKDSVEATVYYHVGSSAQTLTWTRKFDLEVNACPPRFSGRPLVSPNSGSATIERNCPICPGFEFRGTVEFENKTTDESKTIVDFISTAPNQKAVGQEKWINRTSSAQNPQYRLDRYIFGDMDYYVTVIYNEGDSMYRLPVLTDMRQGNDIVPFIVTNQCNVDAGAVVTSSHLSMANICDLVSTPEPDSICAGETVDLYVYSRNLYDTLYGIEWENRNISPVGSGWDNYEYEYQNKTGGKLTRQIKRAHYTVQAQAPGIYPFKLTSKIRDSLVVRYDTIRIAVLDKPRIFITDTVYACEHDYVDLNNYVDNSIVKNVNQHGLIIDDAAGFDKRVATAELRYQCSSGVSVVDTIAISAENPVYNVFVPDTQLCPGNQVTLRAGTNGRITWIKRQQLQGGGFTQPDTLLVNGANDVVLYDTIGNTDCLYTLIARTACNTPPSSMVQFRARALEEPDVQILDRSACRPEPLFLNTKPFDNTKVDSANGVQWFVNGNEYHQPSVPPAESVEVICSVTGLNGCRKSDTIQLHSYEAPKISVVADKQSGSQGRYCADKDTELTFTVQGADTYEWTGSTGGFLSSASIYTHKAVKDDTLYVTGKESKKNCATKDSVLVYLNPYAEVVSDTIACKGETLTIHPQTDTDAVVQWYDQMGNPVDACDCGDLRFDYDEGDVGNWKVEFTRKGCTVSKNVNLEMYPIPNFAFTDTAFCEGDLLRLDVNTGLSSSWQSQSRYIWLDPNKDTLHNSIGTSLYNGKALSLADAGRYYLKILLNRCQSIDSVDIRVDEHSHPSFAVDSFYCEGATLTTTAENQGAGAVYRWSSSNRLPSEGVSPQISLEGLEKADSTWLTLEIIRGACTDDTSVFVHVRSLPIARIVAQNANSDAEAAVYYCEGMPLRLRVEGMRGDEDMRWYHKDVLQEDFTSADYKLEHAVLADSGWYAFHVNRNGCTGKDSLYVDVRVVPVPLVNDTFMCSGVTLVIDAANPLFPGSSFVWQPSNATGSQIDINSGGTYSVVMTYRGCDDTKSFSVEERPSPQIDFPQELTICQRDSAVLSGPDGMDGYLWQDGSTSQTYIVKTEGLYSLFVELAGCSDYREVTVHEDFCSNLYFPSAFTPNGDGHNDRFGPITTAEDDQVVYSLYIYNRSGEKVFESHSLKESWDGTFKGEKCPAGMYVYTCKAHAKQNGRNLSENGTLSLIR